MVGQFFVSQYMKQARLLAIETDLNSSRGALFHMKTKVCQKYFINDCPWKQFLAFNLAQTPSNFVYLTIFVNLSVKLKLDQLFAKKCQN